MKNRRVLPTSFWTVMKITLSPLLLLIVLGGVSIAGPSRGQDVLSKRVSLQLKEAAFRSALASIEQQTSIQFMYSNEMIQADRRVSLTARNSTLAEVFSRLFKPLQISYEVLGNRVILTRSGVGVKSNSPTEPSAFEAATTAPAANVPTALLSGKVIDEKAEPLPGVSILVKGTTVGATTDAQGQYQINVPTGRNTLVFSMVGFDALSVDIGTRTVVNVTLTADVKTLGEVVVVGYGTQKKKDLTGSVAQVSGDELTKVSVSTVDQALQGRAAGVVVTSNDGTPGGSNSVRIRGLSSVNNNDPLYVVDGIIAPNGINTLNPGDIETIDVLKDASATAIYGVQAANGVIIVTTKKGRADKPTITFDAYQGLQNAWRTIPMMNARQLGTVINEALANAVAQDSSLLNNPAFKQNPDVATYGAGTDWQKEIFRTARMQDYTLGISGGNKNTTYSFGAGYRNQQGIVLNSDFQRYTVRANVENRTERFTAGGGVNYGYTSQRSIYTNSENDGTLSSALEAHPLMPVRDPQDPTKYGKLPPFGSSIWAAFVRNPVSIAERADNRNLNQNLFGTLYGEYQILQGLRFRSQIGVSYYAGSYKSFSPRMLDVDKPIYNNSLYEGDYSGVQWNWDNTLSYSRGFGGHNVTLLAGVSAQNRRSEGGNFSQSQFDNESPSLRFIGFGDPKTLTGQRTASERSLYSQFVRATYDFNERYYFTGTVRWDRSSAFAPERRLGTFPSASVGWRLSREPFLKNVKGLTDLKLRASWGITGNQSSVNDYPLYTQLLSSLSNSGYVLGPGQDGTVPGARPTQLGNRDISWETTEQTDIGADVSLWDNRIQLTLDYYNRTTRDMLLQKPLPAIITGGADFPFVNLGSVVNKGFEFAVTYNQRINDLRFSVSANGATLNNRVTDLGPNQYLVSPYGTNQFSAPVNRTFVGSPIATFYGFIADGLFRTQAEVDAANRNAIEKSNGAVQFAQTSGTRAGDVRFKDLNGDGVIDDNDKTIIGNPLPTFTYGFNLTASFRAFDFSAFLQGVTGNQVFNLLRYRGMGDFANGFNKFALLNDRWTPENPNATYPRVITTDPNQNWTGGRVSSLYVEDGAYARLRSMQLGYTLPVLLAKKVSMQRLRFYVSAQNLFTITKYTGFDPEIGLNSLNGGDATRNLQIGVDRGAYPQPRTFLIGVNATF